MRFKYGDIVGVIAASKLEIGIIVEANRWTDVYAIETSSGLQSACAYRITLIKDATNYYYYFEGSEIMLIKAKSEGDAKDMLHAMTHYEPKLTVDQGQFMELTLQEAWGKYQLAMREKKGVNYHAINELNRFIEPIPSVLVLDDRKER